MLKKYKIIVSLSVYLLATWSQIACSHAQDNSNNDINFYSYEDENFDEIFSNINQFLPDQAYMCESQYYLIMSWTDQNKEKIALELRFELMEELPNLNKISQISLEKLPSNNWNIIHIQKISERFPKISQSAYSKYNCNNNE